MLLRMRNPAVGLLLLLSSFVAYATCPLAPAPTATLTVSGNESSGDSGNFTIDFNGFTETVHYGQFSTQASIASAFGAMFTRDFIAMGLYAKAGACGTALNVITFQLANGSTFGPLNIVGPSTSFSFAASGFGNPVTTADTGTATLWFNGTAISTAKYGDGSTGASIAQDLALNASSTLVTVTSQGQNLYLQSKQTGAYTDSYSVTFSTSLSFSSTPASGTLSASTGAPSPVAIYNYNAVYDSTGNILGLADSVMGMWAYGYDSLNRLTSGQASSLGGPYANQYTCWSYDSFGNRLSQSVSRTPCGSSPAPTYAAAYSANNQIASVSAPANVTVQYDGAGNVTNDGYYSYVYDAEGHLCAVDGPEGMVGYQYDAEGRRIGKGMLQSMSCDTSPSNYTPVTEYVLDQGGGQMTEMAVGSGTTTWQHTNVTANGMLIATYDTTGSGLHFYLNDPLGTRRVQTDAAGFPEQTCQSLPFGDQLYCTGSPTSPTEQHFTGKERDAESGLDYFKYRMYASNMGRFMSPDTYGGRLADPQSLNKYAYARNNPLIYVDPDGHDFNLTGCGTTNSATCQNNMVGTTSTDANGKSTFTATVISNGANGLQDQAGNSYSGTVTSAGVSFQQSGSNTSYGGSWINGSADTSFTQTGGALNGFSFNFSQPNTATGQTLAGTFSYGDNMSASQAGKALEAAGFSHSYFDAIANPLHGYDVTHYRGGGDPNTGAGAAHFILDDPYKVDDGFVMGPVRAGDFHYGETDPRVAPVQHIMHDVIPSFFTPH